jgi:uncharacterized membrane protein (UPF0182 family)
MSPDGGTTSPVFSLTSPLVSLTRRNLTAYVSVNSQPGADYGRFTLLTVPANAGLPGPGQVQNELDSNTTISPQLTLLGSGDSEIIKGNLLTVPVAGSMLYVEPLYVKAAGGQTFPVLRKFLVYSDGNAAYESTLVDALNAVFGVKGSEPVTTPPSQPSEPSTPPSASSELRKAIAEAKQDEADAEAALRNGDLEEYARKQAEVKQDLERIDKAANTAAGRGG